MAEPTSINVLFLYFELSKRTIHSSIYEEKSGHYHGRLFERAQNIT